MQPLKTEDTSMNNRKCWKCYTRAIKGGGAVITSTGDGGAVITSTADGGEYSSTTPDGGGHTLPSEGAHRHRMFQWVGTIWEGVESMNTGYAGGHSHSVTNDFPSGTHNHGNPDYVGTGQHSHTLGTSYESDHRHSYLKAQLRTWDCQDVNGNWRNIGIGSPAVYDDIWTYESAGLHSHEVQDHQHAFSVPDHQHSITLSDHQHDIELADHEHEIEFGIYQGPTPTEVIVKVDGNEIPGLGLSEESVDILDYLERDAEGKIVRGWHELEITPNDLGRVNVTLHLQLFVQSRGDATL